MDDFPGGDRKEIGAVARPAQPPSEENTSMNTFLKGLIRQPIEHGPIAALLLFLIQSRSFAHRLCNPRCIGIGREDGSRPEC